MRSIITTLSVLFIVLFGTLFSSVAYAKSYEEVVDNISSANVFYKQMNHPNFEKILFAYNSFYDKYGLELGKTYPSTKELNDFGGCYYNSSGDYMLDVYLTNWDNFGFFEEFFPIEFTNYHIVKCSVFDVNQKKAAISKAANDMADFEFDIRNNTLKTIIDKNSINNVISDNKFSDVVCDETYKKDQVKIYGGDEIKVDTYAHGTVTCCAYDTKTHKYGVLTAAHVVKSVDYQTPYKVNQYIINRRLNCKLNHDIDAAFIPNINTNLVTSSQYKNKSSTKNGYFNGSVRPLDGVEVCIMGISTNEVYAKMEVNSSTDEVKYKFSSSKITQEGDSGAPVVVFTNSPITGERAWIMAIHRGIYVKKILNAEIPTGYGYGCNIKSACEKLGVQVQA